MSHETPTEQLLILKTSGDYSRFKELLRSRLYECGWVDQVHILCRQASKNNKVTVEEIYEEVTHKGRSLVPVSVKKELLLKVKDTLLQRAGYYNKEA